MSHGNPGRNETQLSQVGWGRELWCMKMEGKMAKQRSVITERESDISLNDLDHNFNSG